MKEYGSKPSGAAGRAAAGKVESYSSQPHPAGTAPDAGVSADDEILRPYLQCSNEPAAENLLAELLFDVAEPLLRRVLTRLSGAASPHDLEDITADVILDLMVRLRKSRNSAGAFPIGSFRAYVLTAAHHACDGFFRQRCPQRHRLMNRIRYVLREDPRFAVWTGTGGAAVCGWAAWKGRPDCGRVASHIAVSGTATIASALETVLTEAGQPLEVDDVAGVLAAAWRLDTEPVPIEAVAEMAGQVPHLEARLDNRARLERLWRGILQLPSRQRAALLLHMRDERGGPALALLPASGVAFLAAIAEALEISVEQLADLWNRLPLGDLEIAERLGIARQQVINLRCAARQRLARMSWTVEGIHGK